MHMTHTQTIGRSLSLQVDSQTLEPGSLGTWRLTCLIPGTHLLLWRCGKPHRIHRKASRIRRQKPRTERFGEARCRGSDSSWGKPGRNIEEPQKAKLGGPGSREGSSPQTLIAEFIREVLVPRRASVGKARRMSCTRLCQAKLLIFRQSCSFCLWCTCVLFLHGAGDFTDRSLRPGWVLLPAPEGRELRIILRATAHSATDRYYVAVAHRVCSCIRRCIRYPRNSRRSLKPLLALCNAS